MNRKIKYILCLLLIFLVQINVIIAADCASEEEVNKHVDAVNYCYYNSNALPGDYNAIVGISSDGKKVYSDIGDCDTGWNGSIGGPGTEPIKNWIKDDSEWDSDLSADYSAYKYYQTTGKCPEILYVHYYPMAHSVYLINSDQLSGLLSTFSYNLAKDNEEKYYLVNFDIDNDTTVEKTCSYSTQVKDNNASTKKNKDLNFDLQINKNGNIINASSLGDRISLSTEMGSNYDKIKDVCPNIYVCHVVGQCYSAGGTSACEYEYELYFSDYVTLDNRSDCEFISCKNTDKSYCQPSNSRADICPIYDDLYGFLEEDYNELKNDRKNISKIEDYNDSLYKLKFYCNNIYKYLDYSNPCVSLCIEVLEEDIAKNLFDNQIDSKCGFSGRLLIWIGNIVRWVKYIVPVIVIVLGILDFIKAMASSKEDEMKKAQKGFVIRLVSAALIFIIPFIIEFVLEKMGFTANGCGIIDL